VENEENQILTIDQKLQNALQLVENVKNDFNNFDRAKSFIKNCLVPEKMSLSDAESYIKYKIGKEYHFEGREGTKMITDLKKLYENELEFQAKLQREEAKKVNDDHIKTKAAQTGIVNDTVLSWEKYVYPEGYSSKNGKIVKTEEQMNFRTGEIETIDTAVSLTPFIICGKTAEKEDTLQYFTIRYALNNSYSEFIAPMTDLLNINTMQNILTGHGINVSANQKIAVNDYITDFIHQFRDNLKVNTVIQQNGWNDDFSLFAMGKIGITKDGIVKINTLIDTDKHILPFVQKGKLECWVKGVIPVVAHDKPRFLFYHGMSSALINILKVEQDIIDITGDTSTGKTGTNAVVSSAIANPSCKPDGYALEVGDSFNPLMAHAAGLRDMPVIFEEATGKERREAVIKAAYNIANGVDKTRSQKNGKIRNDVNEIRSNVLISCEQPISGEVKTAGGRQRVKDLACVLQKSDENGKMIDKTKKIVFENYGLFFPIYIQKIMLNIPRIKELYEKALTKVTNDFCNLPEDAKSTAGRSRNIFASKLVAGYLCEEIFAEIGIPAKTEEETEKIVNDMFKECVLDNPVELDYIRGLKAIISRRATNPEEFFIKEVTTNPKNLSGEVDGNKLKYNETKLKNLLNDNGISTNVFNDWFNKNITDSPLSRAIRIGGIPARGMIFNIQRMLEVIRLNDNKNKLALFEDDEEETSEETKPYIKSEITIRYYEIQKLISFMTKELGKKSVDPIGLECMLGYDVIEYLKILENQNKVRKTSEGNYYI